MNKIDGVFVFFFLNFLLPLLLLILFLLLLLFPASLSLQLLNFLLPCITIYAGLFHDDIIYPLRLYLEMSLLAV